MIDVVNCHAGLRQAIPNGMGGKYLIVLNAGEALFLCRGNDVAILYQGRRAVVIKR